MHAMGIMKELETIMFKFIIAILCIPGVLITINIARFFFAAHVVIR